jgi:hypothetical protein
MPGKSRRGLAQSCSSVHRGEGGVWQAVVAQEGLFGDAVLADADRRRRRAHENELVEIVEGAGGTFSNSVLIAAQPCASSSSAA